MKRIKVFCISILVVSLSVLPLSSSATSYTKDYKIMNSPTATKQQIKDWAENQNASDLYISLIDEAYDMAVKYEIDPTVMLSQFALETGFCRYTGVIDESYHNPCGLKTSSGGGNYDKKAHMKFDTWEDGFEAQAQHLRLYAGYCHHYRKDCPHDCPKIIDPRHFKEIGGKAIYVSDLSRTWATDTVYGNKLNGMCDKIVNTEIREVEVKEEEGKTESEVEVEEMATLERIKARILKGHSNDKINYIKDLLFNRDKENLVKEYIDKIKNK